MYYYQLELPKHLGVRFLTQIQMGYGSTCWFQEIGSLKLKIGWNSNGVKGLDEGKLDPLLVDFGQKFMYPVISLIRSLNTTSVAYWPWFSNSLVFYVSFIGSWNLPHTGLVEGNPKTASVAVSSMFNSNWRSKIDDQTGPSFSSRFWHAFVWN